MKRILCYGDSNTRGQTGQRTRYAAARQWPNILQRALGEDYWIVQEGMSGRIAGNYEADERARNGQDSFEVAYCSAAPLDLVIVSLGTNDFKQKYARSAQDIASDLVRYKEALRHYAAFGESEGKEALILYLSPSNFVITAGYFEAADQIRQQLVELMRTFDTPILELNNLGLSEDGVHYSEDDHKQVADMVKQKVEEILR